MKKRGFTLVELLAVIVILAIIALIAVPVFLGIINNTKKSSDKEGVNLYTDTVEKAIQKKQVSDPNFQPDKCTIKTDGNLECFNGTTSLGTVKVTMKGTKPSSGTIYITEDDVTYENIVLNGKTYYEVVKATLVNDVAPTGVSIGDKYTYKVNNNNTFNFYVLSLEGDKVNLIMDRNICGDGTLAMESNICTVAWREGVYNNNYGPATAMMYLYNGTKNWTNVPDMVMNYTDEYLGDDNTIGYKGIITNNGATTITDKNEETTVTIGTVSTPLKARLPKESEVKEAGCVEFTTGTCLTWLTNGLESYFDYYPNNEHISGILGYWTLSSGINNNSNSGAAVVFNEGFVTFTDVYAIGSIGVRPVITVSKSDLQ